MASSVSPPAPHHTTLPNPKKRPSLATQSTPASAYAIKRPKLHPLRQTSYPDAQATPFSATPSARSETGSLVSGSSRIAPGSAEKRGRGRPRKGTTQTTQSGAGGIAVGQDRDDGRTLISTDGGAGRGTRSIVSGRSGADEDDEPDLGWAAAPENLDAADVARKEEDEREENRKLL